MVAVVKTVEILGGVQICDCVVGDEGVLHIDDGIAAAVDEIKKSLVPARPAFPAA